MCYPFGTRNSGGGGGGGDLFEGNFGTCVWASVLKPTTILYTKTNCLLVTLHFYASAESET